MNRTARLTAVGLGIQVGRQTSTEAEYAIKTAAKVYYLLADYVAMQWLHEHNPNAESLHHFYKEDLDRHTTYQLMVTEVIRALDEVESVCLVSYGHPGVFAFPVHESIRRARALGYQAQMLPAVSAEDCLIADLGVDPGATGCSSFEATDFLINNRLHDPHSILILWQIGVLGELNYRADYRPIGIDILLEKLLCKYPDDHQIIVYEAAAHPVIIPRIIETRLSALSPDIITPLSTLYVAPLPPEKPNFELADRLGLDLEDIVRRRAEHSIRDEKMIRSLGASSSNA
jgi:uroporphyrin-III C-methyltransferase